MPALVRCPACVAENLKSRFTEQRVETPKAEVERFYDEDGRKHVHDHNQFVRVMSCSNGHSYKQTLQGECPCKGCAWNAQETVLAQRKRIGE